MMVTSYEITACSSTDKLVYTVNRFKHFFLNFDLGGKKLIVPFSCLQNQLFLFSSSIGFLSTQWIMLQYTTIPYQL